MPDWAPPPRPRPDAAARRRAGSDPPSMRPSPGRSLRGMMSAGRSPAPGSARSVAAVNLLRRSSAPVRLSVTAATDRADSLLRGSRKADPPSRHERAAPLRCRGRTGPGTAGPVCGRVETDRQTEKRNHDESDRREALVEGGDHERLESGRSKAGAGIDPCRPRRWRGGP